MSQTKLLSNTEIYDEVLLDRIPKAKHFVWIGTADVKDLYF